MFYFNNYSYMYIDAIPSYVEGIETNNSTYISKLLSRGNKCIILLCLISINYYIISFFRILIYSNNYYYYYFFDVNCSYYCVFSLL